MKKKVNIVLVGTAARGMSLLHNLCEIPEVNIVGVSDLFDERMEKAVAKLVENGCKKPAASKDYRALLEIKGLDAVIAAGSWNSHVRVCLDAMNAGKYAAMEVGGAASLDECKELVATSERTGMPCMMLENCCWGRDEMMIMNMINQGVFGELIHAECGYKHDLRILAQQRHHYRLDHNIHRNCDVYLTHGLGPISQWLGINHGNRMVSLVSMASKGRGFEDWISHNQVNDPRLIGVRFAMGDVVNTIIKCANGETISITHTISLPTPYSRCNVLNALKGTYSEDCKGIYLFGQSNEPEKFDPVAGFYEKYDHPCWQSYIASGVKSGHGGMDYLVLKAFTDAVQRQKPTPIDVYDTACWMATTVLSEESIALGSTPVFFPDFTNGAWMTQHSII